MVFVEYFAHSAKVLVPVADALRAEHGLEVLWLAARQPVRELLKTLGVESLLLGDLAPLACSSRNHLAAPARAGIRKALHQLADDFFTGTGDRVGRAYLGSTVNGLLIDSLNQAAYWLDAMAEAFDRLQPDCLVSTTYSSAVGRAMAAAGRVRGTRSVYVQHGLVPDWPFYARFANDLLLLWGQSNFRTMLRSGIDAERMRVVGATIYDELAQSQVGARTDNLCGANSKTRVALMASRTAGTAVSLAAARRILTTVFQAVQRIPNAELVVKVHPGDRTGLVERTLRDQPRCSVVRDGESRDVIQGSDVVIVISSTTGLEACVADKPLIVLRVPGVSEAVPYEGYRAAVSLPIDGAEAAENLQAAIQELIDSPLRRSELAAGRRRLVDDMLNGGAGDATELTAQAIVELLGNAAAVRRNSYMNCHDVVQPELG